MPNKTSFHSLVYSLYSVVVMMIGELEYSDTFVSHVSEPDDIFNKLHFEKGSLAVLAAFLVLVSIITTNLLTGLAVDDIERLMKNAKETKMCMLIEESLYHEFQSARGIRRLFEWIITIEKPRIFKVVDVRKESRNWKNMNAFYRYFQEEAYTNTEFYVS